MKKGTIDRRTQKPEKDISGQVFHRLTAIKRSRREDNKIYWLFKCECGVEKEIVKAKVVTGETKSCGCYQRDRATSDSTTHGLYGHPLWSKYKDIMNRCYNKNTVAYNSYGGRGVTVCNEWKEDFVSFYNWAIKNGWKPGLQIDKDIKAMELGVEPLLYSPERCQFVTPKINSNNRRSNRFIEYNGFVKTLMEWSEYANIHQATFAGRLKRGWGMKEALSLSTVKTGKTKCFH